MTTAILLSSCSDHLSELETRDWEYSNPQSFGLNPYPLLSLDEKIKEGVYADINSLTIIKDQHVVFENYYHGHKPDELYSLGRGTQSVFYLLAEELMLESDITFKDSLINLLPSYSYLFENIPQKDKITLQHLASNSTGLWWDEWDFSAFAEPNDAEIMKQQNDWLEYVLSKNMIREPGMMFNYNSGHTFILSSVLEDKLPGSLTSEFESRLFAPLGISNWQWEFASSGRLNTMSGLKLTSRGMAKVGTLLLQKGGWKGTQLLSDNWANDLLYPAYIDNAYDYEMGWFQFGIYHPVFGFGNGVAQGFTFMWGEGGQFIFVHPDEEMVVVFTGGFENGLESDYIFNAVKQYVIPTISDDSFGT